MYSLFVLLTELKPAVRNSREHQVVEFRHPSVSLLHSGTLPQRTKISRAFPRSPDENSWVAHRIRSRSLCLWLYSRLDLHRLFSFLIPYTVGSTPWTGGLASRKAATYTQNDTNRINAHRYPCLEWDSNPQLQCSSGRRRLMS
jgi:hypothetical protein